MWKRIKQFNWALVIALLIICIYSLPVLATVFIAYITLTNASSVTYNYTPIILTMDNEWIAANGYSSSTMLDTRITDSSGNVLPYMPADDRTVFVANSIPANAISSFVWSSGNTALTSHDIVVGDGGYITTADNATLEPGDNFDLSMSVYLQSTAPVFEKQNALLLAYNSTSQVLTLTVGNESSPDYTLTASGVTQGLHTVRIVAVPGSTYPSPTYSQNLSGVITVTPKANDNHAEGVDSDGTYLYSTDRFHIYKMNQSGTILATKSNANLEGTDIEQINGINLIGDYIYLGANSYVDLTSWTDPVKYGMIKVFNKSDMSYVTEHSTKYDHWAEGATYFGGYWWVSYFDWMYLSRYDSSWTWQADYALTLGETCNQGIFNDGQYMYVCTSDPANSLGVYSWNGTGITGETSIPIAETLMIQSGGLDPDFNTMWICDKVMSEVDGNILKYQLNIGRIALFVDNIVVDSVTLTGSITDNSNDWVWYPDPYFEYITLETDN